LGLLGKKAGLEVVVQMPVAQPGRLVGEVSVTGRVYGSPDRAFVMAAENSIPSLITDVRRELGNTDERRKHPRVAAELPVTIYPVHSRGELEPPRPGRCKDVSLGGVCFLGDGPIPTKYVYLTFDTVAAVAGAAVLVRVIRSHPYGREALFAGQFRTDL
jgi:hypothetical protein